MLKRLKTFDHPLLLGHFGDQPIEIPEGSRVALRTEIEEVLIVIVFRVDQLQKLESPGAYDTGTATQEAKQKEEIKLLGINSPNPEHKFLRPSER